VEKTMNKKLVTLAVATALAAPAAAMADAVLYGKLNVGINYVDQDGGFEGWGLSDNKAAYPTVNAYATPSRQGPPNRIGVKGSEDLGNGLKAIYQIELGFKLADNNNAVADNGEAITMRNTFVGLSGNWGTLLAGRHDTPLKISTGPLDLFADTLADYNNTVGFQDIRADNAVAYISPSFGGFTLAAAAVPGGGTTVAGSVLPYVDSDSLAEAYSVAGIFKNGPWYASVAYESLGSDLSGAHLNVDDWNKWRVGLGILDWNGFSLTGVYENWSNAYFGSIYEKWDADLWNIQAAYAFGNFAIKAAYGDASHDLGHAGDYSLDSWTVGFDYNMSKRTKAFLLYTSNNADEVCNGHCASTDWDGFQLGLMHSF